MTLLFKKEIQASTPRLMKTASDSSLPIRDPFMILGCAADRSLWTRDKSPFRFFELPQEVQDMVYTYHLQDVDFCIQGSCRDCTLNVAHQCREESIMAQAKGTIPSLAPETVCRKMFTDLREIRNRIWPRTLTIEEKVSVKSVVKQLAQHSKFTWLRGHITEVVFNEISSYALSTQPHWTALALACPGLRTFHIHQRARRGYVDWDPQEYEENAVAEDPDDQNLEAIQPKTFEKLAACLHRNHGDNCTVIVESCIWWSLMLTSPQECLKKINIYSFKHDKHDMLSRMFEVERLVDLRAAETRLDDDWSP